jgi:hypothetical protein
MSVQGPIPTRRQAQVRSAPPQERTASSHIEGYVIPLRLHRRRVPCHAISRAKKAGINFLTDYRELSAKPFTIVDIFCMLMLSSGMAPRYGKEGEKFVMKEIIDNRTAPPLDDFAAEEKILTCDLSDATLEAASGSMAGERRYATDYSSCSTQGCPR